MSHIPDAEQVEGINMECEPIIVKCGNVAEVKEETNLSPLLRAEILA